MGTKRLLQEHNTQLKITHVNLEPSLAFLGEGEGEEEEGDRDRERGSERGGERRRCQTWSVRGDILGLGI